MEESLIQGGQLTRILFVYHVTSVGGGSYCLLNILKAIDRKVFEPFVLLPHRGPLCDEIEKLGIEIVYIPSLVLYPYNKSLFKWSSINTFRKIPECQKGFAEVVRRVAPKIVYMNTMMLFPYLRTAKECGCKTVVHVREHWPLDEHKRQLEWARRCIYNYADKMITINRYSASMFPEKEATIVYDWIDMEARRGGFTLKDLIGNDYSKQRVYLFTGGLQPIKGTKEVLETFTRYIQGEDRRLLVLGVDPVMEWSGFRGKIKRLLSRLGYKTYKEKVVNICRNDKRIVCVPSFYNMTDLIEEVAGNVSYFTIPHANLALAESIILGKPGVAAQTDESLEYSCEGNLALLYRLGNKKAFVGAWLSLDQGKIDLGEKLKKESRKVADMFNPVRNADVLNDVLKTIPQN